MENQSIVALELFQNTIKYNGDDIFIKPFCDLFEIEVDHQQTIIQKDKILQSQSGKKPNELLFGDKRNRTTLTSKGFIRWIQLINPNIIRVELQEKLEYYQCYIFDYLFGSLEQKHEMAIKNKRLLKLMHLYGVVGNHIQNLQRELNGYVQNQLSLDQFTIKKLK